MTDSIVRSRIDPRVKAKATQLFEHMGLTLSEAIRLFIYQSVAEGRIPFVIRVPNAETREALSDITQKKNLKKTSLKKLKQDWENASNNSDDSI